MESERLRPNNRKKVQSYYLMYKSNMVMMMTGIVEITMVMEVVVVAVMIVMAVGGMETEIKPV